MVRRRMLALTVGWAVAGAIVPSGALAAETIFKLGDPVPLPQAVDALGAAGVRVLDVHHSGASEGGFVLGAESLLEAAESYREF